MRWEPGQVVDGYRLEVALGRGAMGEVFRARHLATGAEVALKTFVDLGDPELRLRFAREGQAMARVDQHPHVLRVHALGEVEGGAYLVLELATGGDLEGRLREGPAPPEQVRSWLRALAGGAAHLHAAGVVHRDIKPANVLFDAQGRPKLGDFGLARLGDAQRLTVSGQLLGTPAYMAPEQVTAATQVGPPADVYALGALTYRCLTGRPAVEGGSLAAALEQVLHHVPPDARELAPGTPAPLATLCARMLAKKPEERPTAPEVVAALDAPLASSTPASAPRWPAALGVALVGVLGVAYAAARQTVPGPGPAPASSVQSPTNRRGRLPLPASPGPSAALELKEQARALPAGYRIRCLDDRVAVAITRATVARVPLDKGLIDFAVWKSPDRDAPLTSLAVDRASGRFAVSDQAGAVWVWREGLAGKPTRLERSFARAPDLAIAPGGEWLATRDATSIVVLPVSGGPPRWTLPYTEDRRMYFTFSDPDTLWIARVEGLDDVRPSDLERWDLRAGERVRAWKIRGAPSAIRADPQRDLVAVGTTMGLVYVAQGETLHTLGPQRPREGLTLLDTLRPDAVHGAPVRDVAFEGEHAVTLGCSRRYVDDDESEVPGAPSRALWDLRELAEPAELDFSSWGAEEPCFGLDWIPGTDFVVEVDGKDVRWRRLPLGAR